MLTVLPEKNGQTVEEYYKKEGFLKTENSFAVTAKLGDEFLGYCIFDIKDGTVTVLGIEPQDDIPLADGILRCALHVAAERFIFNAEYDNPKLEKLFETIGFIKDKKSHTLDMDKLFGGCGCGNCK